MGNDVFSEKIKDTPQVLTLLFLFLCSKMYTNSTTDVV